MNGGNLKTPITPFKNTRCLECKGQVAGREKSYWRKKKEKKGNIHILSLLPANFSRKKKTSKVDERTESEALHHQSVLRTLNLDLKWKIQSREERRVTGKHDTLPPSTSFQRPLPKKKKVDERTESDESHDLPFFRISGSKAKER